MIVLDSCGFSNIWENQGNFNSKWLSLSLKQKLFDQFQQKWRSDMNNSSKGLCYKIFKDYSSPTLTKNLQCVFGYIQT
jgi:hypothetical protein